MVTVVGVAGSSSAESRGLRGFSGDKMAGEFESHPNKGPQAGTQ